VQPEVVLLADSRLVQVTAHDLQQILREARLASLLIQAVVHPSAISPCLYQPNCAEFPEMPRDLVLRHAQGIHQLAHAEFPSPQQPEQPEPCWIRQGTQESGDILH
jgi:hypothetical protein